MPVCNFYRFTFLWVYRDNIKTKKIKNTIKQIFILNNKKNKIRTERTLIDFK